MMFPPPLCVFPEERLAEFSQGENPGDRFANDTERPAHRVKISRGFAMGKHPVTVGEFRLFSPGHASNDDETWPVVSVSWKNARNYCLWLSQQTGRSCRLPSETEWEFACRAGSETHFATGDELTLRQANFLFSEFGERVGIGSRSPVGKYPANAFGIHDLHGNVCEWVEDVWHPDYCGAPADGSAWISGSESGRRVIRGGAWDYLPRLLRSAWRDSFPEDRSRDNLGFRIACDGGIF